MNVAERKLDAYSVYMTFLLCLPFFNELEDVWWIMQNFQYFLMYIHYLSFFFWC